MTSKRRALGIVGLILALLLTPAGIAVAQTLTHSASAGVTYQTNSGVTVTLTDQRDVAAVPFTDDQTFQDGTLTVSGSNAAVSVSDTTYSQTPLVVRDVTINSGGSLTVARSDLNQTLTVVDGGASVIQLTEYDEQDSAVDLDYSSAGGVTVRLDGFPAIGVAAVDASTGEPLDTVAVDQSGVAEFTLPSGTNSVRLEPTPSELQVRNEAAPDQLVDGNVTLTARLFAGSGDTVIERQVTNGTVSLAGVPLDQELVITVREANADYVYRRILIESAIQTSEIYILPTTEPAAEVRFQIADETGRFQSENTRLFVEKPITRANSTEYRVISGDRVGADGEFPTILVDSQRYRLRVENDQGEQRVLGSYVVQGARVARIPIGEVQFSADVSEGAAMQASLRQAPSSASYSHEVRIVYLDPEGTTDSIEISVTNSTGGQIRPTTTEQLNGTANAYVETYPITQPFDPEQDTATIDVTATQGVEQQSFTTTVGDVPEILTNAPIDTQVLEIIGLVSIVAVVGLLVIVSPTAAAVVGPGYAGALTITGVVPIPLPAVVLAGLIGILASVGTRSGRL